MSVAGVAALGHAKASLELVLLACCGSLLLAGQGDLVTAASSAASVTATKCLAG